MCISEERKRNTSKTGDRPNRNSIHRPPTGPQLVSQ